jgi:putative oxidoreductase
MIRSDDWALLLGRLFVGALFVPSGFGKLVAFNAFAASLASKGLPVPEAWAALAVAFELGGGLLVVLGAFTRMASLGMVAFTAMAIMLSHRYWTFADAAQRRANEVQFWKDLALIGGLLFLHVAGAGRLSVDGWFAARAQPEGGRPAYGRGEASYGRRAAGD